MEEFDEVRLRIAQSRAGIEDPDAQVLAGVDGDQKRIADTLMADGMDESEAVPEAWKMLEELGSQPHKDLSGVRERQKKFIKEGLLYFKEQGHITTTSKDICEYAQEHFSYHTDDSKGVGDAMGFGRGGLGLEPAEKTQGRKAYRIPDPEVYAAWYESDVPLPKNYYTPDFYRMVVVRESRKPKSDFIKRRLNQ